VFLFESCTSCRRFLCFLSGCRTQLLRSLILILLPSEEVPSALRVLRSALCGPGLLFDAFCVSRTGSCCGAFSDRLWTATVSRLCLCVCDLFRCDYWFCDPSSASCIVTPHLAVRSSPFVFPPSRFPCPSFLPPLSLSPSFCPLHPPCWRRSLGGVLQPSIASAVASIIT